MTGLEIAAGAMSLGSGAAGAFGAFGKAGATRDALEAKSRSALINKQLDEYNAQLADRNASISLSEGESDAIQKRAQTTRTLASIRTAFGANGLDTGASSLDVLQDAALQGALDEGKIGYKADITATAQRDKAAQYRAQAVRDQMEADAAQTSADDVSPWGDVFGSIFKSGSSLLGNKGVQTQFG